MIDVAAVIGQDAELPCDISTPGIDIKKIDSQIERYINRLKDRRTDRKIDRQIKRYIDR